MQKLTHSNNSIFCTLSSPWCSFITHLLFHERETKVASVWLLDQNSICHMIFSSITPPFPFRYCCNTRFTHGYIRCETLLWRESDVQIQTMYACCITLCAGIVMAPGRESWITMCECKLQTNSMYCLTEQFRNLFVPPDARHSNTIVTSYP